MKYSMFIGRWQPWHDGHRWLIDQRLNQNKNVLICIREVGLDDSNPYDPVEVKHNIEKELDSDLLFHITCHYVHTAPITFLVKQHNVRTLPQKFRSKFLRTP